jgi:quercetin dioxygenase-like cupin family protein
MSVPDHVHSKNSYPGSELERQASSPSVFNLPEIIEDIQASANDLTHEGRTRVLIDSPDHVTIVSGYQPGEGETLHAHPTHNTLLFLAGTFDLWLIGAEGEEEHHETYPGMLVALDRGQPHRVQARADQEGLSIVMVSIVEGMSTSAPGYSVPVGILPTD